MNISPELFKKLIDATETSSLDYFLQIIGIVAPLIFAVWVSRFESNKLKQEEENKDRILDQRQQKLEKIQDSIKGSIEELTTKHNELVDTQKAVEQNLTELKILSAQSRQANILTLQSVYREFFDKYKQFELDLKEVEKFRKEHEDDLDSHELSEDIVDELYKVYAKIKDPVIRDLDAEKIQGSGVGGRITREDIAREVARRDAQKAKQDVATEQNTISTVAYSSRSEKRVPMTRLRKRIAERLLEAKNTTAMLTTFNEVDMQPIMKLRKTYGEKFEKQHGVRLGFMSFYIKAVVEALKRYPEVNASIDGDDIVYHNYFDISIAVSTPRGLVTPVLRNCDKLSMADIEKQIKSLAEKGRDGKLTVEDLTGGNFTITNGGVFGSLMSTPIINPPQSAILGMHAIKERPVAVDGQVVIRPMMYLALSYDHRLIDGRESVGFLVAIKDLLEDPTRLLLEI